MKTRTKKYIALLAAGVFLLLINACTITEPTQNNSGDAIERALKDGLRNNSSLSASDKKNRQNMLPPSVQNALMPEVNIPNLPSNTEANDEGSDQRFDIAVNNVPAKDFFMGLIKDTKYNITVNPQITGNISLELKAVTVPQAMEATRDAYGFEYEKTSYGYAVFPRRLETRIFNVNYIDVDRLGQSQTSIGSGQITSTVQNTLTSSGVSSSQQSGSMPSGIIQTSTTSKFWELMQLNLTAIIGTLDGRSIVVNPRSGVIIVKAYPDELRNVARYLDSIQNIIHRQVIIEAKILEVELKAQFQSGINWKLLGLSQGFTSALNNRTGATPDDSGNKFSTTELPTSFSSFFSANTTYGGTFSSLINLLNDQGNVNVLSSPRVATINNQKAVIKVGNDKFFVTNVSSNTNSSSGSSTNTTANITLTPFFSGISLDVTPQIDENGNVTMHIHPIVSSVIKDTQTFKVNGEDQILPLAASSTRESDSIVRAKNGQVIVIGGLIQNSGENYQASTPGADRLPGIGGLFKSKNKLSRKFELVILLRPIIVESTKTWQQQLQEAATSVKKLNKAKGNFSYNIVPTKQK
ncbi:MAG TPA: pilus (MSHA type) biogenesis protein MshL [Coxiellaceae bacterium]|nr:pilus (MSHA type) biogenesis protein MshL [Coxiellaceae bacterium]HBY55848.1 pilus (MSHA type) biogenesis protein MshL [Coxiellaceae bacterium]